MPKRHYRHKRNIRYYLKKIFPFLYRPPKFRGKPVEEASPDTKFLTLKEVREAQAAAMVQGSFDNSVDNTKFFESANYQQRPPIPVHVRRKKPSKSKFRRLLDQFSFNRFKRRRKSQSRENYEVLSFEELKRAKERLNSEAETFSLRQEAPIQTPNSDREQVRTHKRRSSKPSFSRRLIRLFRKKRDIPLILPGVGDLEDNEKPKIKFGAHVRPIIISTAAFMIAYQLVWLVYQFAVMLVASFNEIDSVLYYYEVMFPIGNTSPKWTQASIIFITLAGPLFSLIMWAVYRHVILRRFKIGPTWRLFFVWLTLGSMMMFFGAFVAGAITRQGFGFVVNWLYMSIAFRIFFSMIFLSFIIWLSWNIVRFLPESSGSDSWKNNRSLFILSRLILPWLIGGSIMVLLKVTYVVPQHDNIFDYDLIILGSYLFAVVPPLFNSKVKPHHQQNRKTYPRFRRISVFKWSLIAIFFVLLIRFGILNGIHFLLRIGLEMGWYH
jgi:hypothetical protein